MDPPHPAVALISALALIVGAGCDGPSAPEGMDGKVIVARGPDGIPGMVDDNAFLADISTADGTSGGSFSCLGVDDCWAQCPAPRQDGGSTTCTCDKVEGGDDDSADDRFLCDVTFHGPGEHPWETGGGGCGGGGAGGGPGEGPRMSASGRSTQGRCVLTKCGDARDGLAKEYADKEEEIWGSWPCTKFKRSNTGLIGVGPEGYHKYHDGYGLVHPKLPAGITKTEAHFDITMVPTSGYRCPVRNAVVSENDDPYRSHHIFGHAVDFKTETGWTAELKDSIFRWGHANSVESLNYPPEKGNHNHLAWDWSSK